MPTSESWAGVAAPDEPESTVMAVAAATQADLRPTAEASSDEGTELSNVSKPDRELLRDVAKRFLAEVAFDAAMNEAAVAIGLAEGIDAIAGYTFMPFFKGKGELTVRPGTVYPVDEYDPSPWMGENGPNTQPSNYPTRALMSTKRLRVGTSDAALYTYVLDFHYWDILADVGVVVDEARQVISYDELVAAVGQPNADLDEFKISFSQQPPYGYLNHGPEEHEPNAKLIGKMMEAARGAHVLVFPEYCLALESRELVIKELTERTGVPRLVVAGVSDGTDDDGYVINHAVLIITTSTGHAPHVVALPQKLHPATSSGVKERIRKGPEVRVIVAQRWRIATLICFDAMEPKIITQLAEFGVNLLLVPALSEKTAALIGSATLLCTRSQAFVVIATGPGRWERTKDDWKIASPQEQRWEAVFGGPYAVGDPHVRARSAPGAPKGGRDNLWMFNFAKRELTAHIIHNS